MIPEDALEVSKGWRQPIVLHSYDAYEPPIKDHHGTMAQ